MTSYVVTPGIAFCYCVKHPLIIRSLRVLAVAVLFHASIYFFILLLVRHEICSQCDVPTARSQCDVPAACSQCDVPTAAYGSLVIE